MFYNKCVYSGHLFHANTYRTKTNLSFQFTVLVTY